MSSEIKQISTGFYCKYSFTESQVLEVSSNTFQYSFRFPILKIGIVTTVALAAIALAILAFLNISGIDVSIFHSLGCMGKAGALVMVAIGTTIISICVTYIIKKNRRDKKINKKMRLCFPDEGKLKEYFDYLDKQPLYSNANAKTNGRYMVISEEQEKENTPVTVWVLQSDGKQHIVSFFRVLSGFAEPTCPEFGCEDYEKKLEQFYKESTEVIKKNLGRNLAVQKCMEDLNEQNYIPYTPPLEVKK